MPDTPADEHEAARLRRSRNIRLLVPVIVALLLLGLVGTVRMVGRGGGALGDLRSASDRAHKAGSVQLRLRMTLRQPGRPARTTEATGTLDAKADKAHLFLYPVLAEDRLEIVAEGSTMYLSIPPAKQRKLGDKRWVRVDAGSPEAARGAALGPIPDPLSFLAATKAAVGPTGPVTSNAPPPEGVHRSFRATIDPRRIPKRLARAQAQVLRGLGNQPFPVEAHLDRDGRLLRARMEVPAPEESTFVVVLDLFEYGKPVLIGVPPADATVPAADAAAALKMVEEA